ncbi:MAG: hypothetical protein IKB73_05530 [Ruminococcus sp.]|nr:hypothetical protein [Ruminococcus sp.]
MKELPLLGVKDVELRVQSVNKNDYGAYAQLLLYKNARVDMRVLDEVFGVMNWKREHTEINGNLFCTVSVWDDEKGQWISKQDVGTESNTEAIKGQASDAFKRSCTCIGIGRELYSAPTIRIKLDDKEVSLGQNGKPRTYAKFHIGEMEYDRDKGYYTKFTVLDEKGEVRFDINKGKELPSANQDSMKSNITKSIPEQQDCLCSECGTAVLNPKVIQFSRQKYGSTLCYACQRKAG